MQRFRSQKPRQQGGRSSFGQNRGRSNFHSGASRGGGYRPSYRGKGGRGQAKALDHSFFIQKAIEQEIEVYTPKHSFSDFNLDPKIAQNIVAKGYTIPTPIQDQAIPYLLEGNDMIGIASTGTGKTAAFLIPLIQKIYTKRGERALIIAPTRELAVQIEGELKEFTKGLFLFSAVCIGGVGMYPQIKSLSRNPEFVIGTPGRLRDLERQRKINFANYSIIVLDEVDRMLDMGFIQEMKYILEKLKQPRQSLFFSATMPESVKKITPSFLNNPVTVSVKASKPSTNVDQDVIKLNGRQKIDVLHDLLRQDGFEKVLVFGRTKWGIEKLSRALLDKGIKAASIHGNKKQSQRQRAIEDFKNNRIQVLLATDIASRGLDIDQVTHVINYDQPQSYEDYIHRIGRTGRANRKGFALTFID